MIISKMPVAKGFCTIQTLFQPVSFNDTIDCTICGRDVVILKVMDKWFKLLQSVVKQFQKLAKKSVDLLFKNAAYGQHWRLNCI